MKLLAKVRSMHLTYMPPNCRGVVTAKIIYYIKFIFMSKFSKLSRAEMKKVMGGLEDGNCPNECSKAGDKCSNGVVCTEVNCSKTKETSKYLIC